MNMEKKSCKNDVCNDVLTQKYNNTKTDYIVSDFRDRTLESLLTSYPRDDLFLKQEWKEKLYTALKNEYFSIEKLIQIVESSWTEHDLKEGGELRLKEILNEIQGEIDYYLQNIDEKKVQKIHRAISAYFGKIFENFELYQQYHHNPKNFFKDPYWGMDIEEIKHPIQLEFREGFLVFLFHPDDFKRMESQNGINGSIGFFDAGKGVIVVSDDKHDPEQVLLTIVHELRHAKNEIIEHARRAFYMHKAYENEKQATDIHWEESLRQAFTRARDEIVAQYGGGETPQRVRQTMMTSYHYFDDALLIPAKKAILEEEYFKKLEKYLQDIEYLIRNGVSLDALMMTPIQKWHRLKKIAKLELKSERELLDFEKRIISDKGKNLRQIEKIFQNNVRFVGIFDESGELIEGGKYFGYFSEEGRFKDGKLVQGNFFSQADGSILEGYHNISFPDGFTRNGFFDYGVLRKGEKIEYIDGEKIWEEGKFDEHEFLISGARTMSSKNGDTEWEIGEFDAEEGELKTGFSIDHTGAYYEYEDGNPVENIDGSIDDINLYGMSEGLIVAYFGNISLIFHGRFSIENNKMKLQDGMILLEDLQNNKLGQVMPYRKLIDFVKEKGDDKQYPYFLVENGKIRPSSTIFSSLRAVRDSSREAYDKILSLL